MVSPFRADHRPPRAGQDISGAGRKTGVSWRQATTRQGAGAMGWDEMDGEKREGWGGGGMCPWAHSWGGD